MGHGASEEGLAAASCAGDEQVLVARHPVGPGEAEHGGPLKATWCAEVDLFDRGSVAQLGGLKSRLETSGLAPIGFTVDEEAEAVLEGEVGVGPGVVELVAEGGGHGAEPDRLELGDGGLRMHVHHASFSVL